MDDIKKILVGINWPPKERVTIYTKSPFQPVGHQWFDENGDAGEIQYWTAEEIDAFNRSASGTF